MARIFVDTNVLFPFSVMDLMLALTEDAVHEVIWTETLLAEWERVIVRQHYRSAESAASITAAIREFFPESQIAEEDYAPLVASMPGADPDDRHHMAAAISGRARILVTWNLRDFPAEPLAALGLRVVDPDQYLCELLNQFPQEVTATVVRLAGEKRHPPKTPTDLANDLAKAGVETFADRLRQPSVTQGGCWAWLKTREPGNVAAGATTIKTIALLHDLAVGRELLVTAPTNSPTVSIPVRIRSVPGRRHSPLARLLLADERGWSPQQGEQRI